MSDSMILFILILGILFLGCAVVSQLFFRRRTRKALSAAAKELARILDQDSAESVMVFTDNPGIMELVSQINRLLKEKSRVREEFRRLELSSRKMLSNISHDIRTPMTVVLGYLEMMREQGDKNEEMLEKAQRKAESVMELTDQFFTLAKLEAGDADMEISGVDLCELCRETVLDFYEILTRDGFQVEVSIPGEAVLVYGNRQALGRILSNLISNAIRYGGAGRYLGIALRVEGDYVLADVTDKGAGIDRAFAERIFDRLFTLEDSRSRQIQGNGLGLTIARNLARQLGGDLVLCSIPGERTVFTVRLKKYPFTGQNQRNERNL